jgi:hypothetical protein
MSVVIHNQRSNTELISPVYFSNGAVCPKLSDQQIDSNIATKIRFEVNTTQDEFEGALLYKLRRNLHDQYSMDTLITETNRNDTTHVYMFVAWKMKDSIPFLCVVLVECAKEFIWDENKLKKLHDKNCDRLKKFDDTISDTWIVDDNMILKATFGVRDLKGNFELSMSISEEERDNYAMRPLWIDLTR